MEIIRENRKKMEKIDQSFQNCFSYIFKPGQKEKSQRRRIAKAKSMCYEVPKSAKINMLKMSKKYLKRIRSVSLAKKGSERGSSILDLSCRELGNLGRGLSYSKERKRSAKSFVQYSQRDELEEFFERKMESEKKGRERRLGYGIRVVLRKR
jgi:hypothetical protein